MDSAMECGNPISHIRQTDIVERELCFKSSLEMFFVEYLYEKGDVDMKSENTKQNIYYVVREKYIFINPFHQNSVYIQYTPFL